MSLYLECDKQTADQDSIPFQNCLTNCFFHFPESQSACMTETEKPLYLYSKFLIYYIIFFWLERDPCQLYWSDLSLDDKSNFLTLAWLMSDIKHAIGIPCLLSMLHGYSVNLQMDLLVTSGSVWMLTAICIYFFFTKGTIRSTYCKCRLFICF